MKDIVSDQGAINRRFVVSAVDVNTGDYIAMTQENTVFEDLAQSSLSLNSSWFTSLLGSFNLDSKSSLSLSVFSPSSLMDDFN